MYVYVLLAVPFSLVSPCCDSNNEIGSFLFGLSLAVSLSLSLSLSWTIELSLRHSLSVTLSRCAVHLRLGERPSAALVWLGGDAARAGTGILPFSCLFRGNTLCLLASTTPFWPLFFFSLRLPCRAVPCRAVPCHAMPACLLSAFVGRGVNLGTIRRSSVRRIGHRILFLFVRHSFSTKLVLFLPKFVCLSLCLCLSLSLFVDVSQPSR